MPPTPSSKHLLLIREDFRRSVFNRDSSCCIACHPGVGAGRQGQNGLAGNGESLDAHHLLNRNLWTEPTELGGYFIDNGVTLCSEHHMVAETTLLSPSKLRELAGINTVLLPQQLDPEDDYDTWGNTLLPNGTRLRGPLYNEEACQKALSRGQVLNDFLPYVKYPRTPHLPFSEGAATGDLRLNDTPNFLNKEVVVTEKLDGESATLYHDFYHARSLATPHHPSQTKIKAFHAAIQSEIPPLWRVCVENCAAVHTFAYDDLETLFPVTSIWDENNRCLSWDETLDWCQLLSLSTAPVLYRGLWDTTKVKSCSTPMRGTHKMEGYVVRLASDFSYSDFKNSVAKFVSSQFRQSLLANNQIHWSVAPVRWNRIKGDNIRGY